jgi:hypothetical protein
VRLSATALELRCFCSIPLLSAFSQIVSLSLKFDPGIGSKISFWEDIWCGESSLKDTFPDLFSIAKFKEVSIADNVELSNGAA